MPETCFEVVQLYHSRPDGESWNINAASDADAVRILREWITNPDVQWESAESWALYDGPRRIVVLDYLGGSTE